MDTIMCPCWCMERAGHRVTAQQGRTAGPTWGALNFYGPTSWLGRCKRQMSGPNIFLLPKVPSLPLFTSLHCALLHGIPQALCEDDSPTQQKIAPIFTYWVLLWIGESNQLITDPTSTRTSARVREDKVKSCPFRGNDVLDQMRYPQPCMGWTASLIAPLLHRKVLDLQMLFFSLFVCLQSQCITFVQHIYNRLRQNMN